MKWNLSTNKAKPCKVNGNLSRQGGPGDQLGDDRLRPRWTIEDYRGLIYLPLNHGMFGRGKGQRASHRRGLPHKRCQLSPDSAVDCSESEICRIFR
jgi:hypothetical protein